MSLVNTTKIPNTFFFLKGNLDVSTSESNKSCRQCVLRYLEPTGGSGLNRIKPRLLTIWCNENCQTLIFDRSNSLVTFYGRMVDFRHIY